MVTSGEIKNAVKDEGKKMPTEEVTANVLYVCYCLTMSTLLRTINVRIARTIVCYDLTNIT